MSSTIRNLIFAFIASFFLIITLVFGVTYLKQVSGANSLQNITRMQVYLHADEASRVKDGVFYLTQDAFENAVARDYSHNNNGKLFEEDDVGKGETARTDEKSKSKYDTADDGIKFTYVVETDDKYTQKDVDDGVVSENQLGDHKLVTKSLLDKTDNVIAVKAKTSLNGEPHTTNVVIITTSTTAG
jgi:hypothetical protein